MKMNGILETEKGIDHGLLLLLDSRGVTQKQHEVKMRNLAAVSRGGVVIKALAHDKYQVGTRPGEVYNPYTDEWKQEER